VIFNGNLQTRQREYNSAGREIMAVDHVENDYHLTPRGWVPGDSRGMFVGSRNASPIPDDRLITLTHKTYQSSRHSPEERSVKVAWRGEATDEQIAELRAKYPPPFDPADE
jgi:hypothetical protein